MIIVISSTFTETPDLKLSVMTDEYKYTCRYQLSYISGGIKSFSK